MKGATLYCARYLLPIGAPPLEDGALLVDAGRIVAVGGRKALSAAHPAAAIVDFGDAVLLPPMVNAHTHLELTDFDRWARDAGETQAPATFVDWIMRLVRVRRTVGQQALRDSLAAGLRRSLLAGTGAIGDILTTFPAADAYRHSPLAGRVFAEVLGRGAEQLAARLATLTGLLASPPGPALAWGLSPHAPYTLSPQTLAGVFRFGTQHALPRAIHLAESPDEVSFLADGSGPLADCLRSAVGWDPVVEPPPGCSPVAALTRPGLLDDNDLVIHGVQVAAQDIHQLARSGCAVVLCPRSNARLAVGKAPLAAYLRAGIPLALGTDSLASASSLSLWEEIAFALEWFAGEAAPDDLLAMATRGGAAALGISDQLGCLSVGCGASFQVVTLPQLPSLSSLPEALCAAGSTVQVGHLYLAGRNVLPSA